VHEGGTYAFTTIERLLDDFERDVEEWSESSRQSLKLQSAALLFAPHGSRFPSLAVVARRTFA
jgi:hypothetical protein